MRACTCSHETLFLFWLTGTGLIENMMMLVSQMHGQTWTALNMLFFLHASCWSEVDCACLELNAVGIAGFVHSAQVWPGLCESGVKSVVFALMLAREVTRALREPKLWLCPRRLLHILKDGKSVYLVEQKYKRLKIKNTDWMYVYYQNKHFFKFSLKNIMKGCTWTSCIFIIRRMSPGTAHLTWSLRGCRCFYSDWTQCKVWTFPW